MTLRDKLFSFNGRLRRQDWWLLGIGWGLFAGCIGEIAMRLIFGPEYSMFGGGLVGSQEARLTYLPACVAYDLIMLALAWPQLALSAKRAHDRAQAAWPVIAATLILSLVGDVRPYLALFPDLVISGTTALAIGIVWSIFSFCVGLWLFITLGCLDGTPGPNRFGPSPKGLSGGAPSFMAPGGLG